MSIEANILDSLGVDQGQTKKTWLKNNGWTFWASTDRRWHFFREDGGALRSLCGKWSAPIGEDLCEQGWKATDACKGCTEKLRAENIQPELAMEFQSLAGNGRPTSNF